MKFLRKYRFTIIFSLAFLILGLWIMPSQEKLYLESDYELLEKWASTFCKWFVGILVIVGLFFALKEYKSREHIGNVILGLLVLIIPVFIFLNALVFPILLLLNRIDSGKSLEKKYIVTYFRGIDNERPQIFDLRHKYHLDLENIKHTEKLDNFKVGDTATLAFQKGLLGVGFNPEVK